MKTIHEDLKTVNIHIYRLGLGILVIASIILIAFIIGTLLLILNYFPIIFLIPISLYTIGLSLEKIVIKFKE